MMAYARPSEEKQVLVKMGPKTDTGTAASRSRRESAPTSATTQQNCVAFYESRRSGNIAVAVTPMVMCGREESAIAGRVHQAKSAGPSMDEQQPREPEKHPSKPPAPPAKGKEPSARVKAATAAPPAASKPHSAMPIAAPVFSRDSMPFAAPAPAIPEHDVIASMMDHDRRTEEVGSSAGSPTASMHRGKIDSQLSRIIDAWPGLSPTNRQAMIAVLEGTAGVEAPTRNINETAAEAQRLQSAEGKDRAVLETGESRRRRSRKPASPLQQEPGTP
jgi:hypothetical protein